MSKEEAVETAEKPKGSSKKFLIIVVAIVVLVLAAGGAALYVLMAPPAAEKQAKGAKDGHAEKADHGDEADAGHGGDGEEEEEEEGHDEEHPPVYEKLETFTVNLADRESLLQVEIHLLMADAVIQGKLKERMPEVRNDILRILSSKVPDELATNEGKDALAKELQTKVNELLGKKKSKGVKKVLFNSFILQ